MVINYWLMGIQSRETSGWQSPAVWGGGVHWAVGGGSPGKKLGRGGRGMAAAAAVGGGGGGGGPREKRRGGGGGGGAAGGGGGGGGVVSGRAGRPRAAGAGGSAGGGWRLRGVEFDDKLEALDFVSNGWKI